MEKQIRENVELFKLDGKPSLGLAFPQALQHVLAMLVGNITPPMLIASTLSLPPEEEIMLTQAAMIIGGITTLLQLYPVLGFGMGLPTDPYSQNVGLICTTKVVAKRVFLIVGVIMLAAGICPRFSALMATIPQPVLGGATVTVFAVITMSGIQLLGDAELSGLPVRHGGPGVQHAAGQHLAGQLFCPPGAV